MGCAERADAPAAAAGRPCPPPRTAPRQGRVIRAGDAHGPDPRPGARARRTGRCTEAVAEAHAPVNTPPALGLRRGPGRRAYSRSNSRSSTPSRSSSSSPRPRRRGHPRRGPRPRRRSSSSLSSPPSRWECWKRSISRRAGVVDRRLLGDLDPVGGLDPGRFEDLVVDLGRVVDDDHDLGLRVEVGARAAGSARRAGSGGRCASRVYTPPSGRRSGSFAQLLQRARHLGSTSSASLPCRARRSLRASTSWRTSSTSAGSCSPDRCASAEQLRRPRRRCPGLALPARRGARCGPAASGGLPAPARRARRRGEPAAPPCGLIVAFLGEPALSDLVVHRVAAARHEEQHGHHEREGDGADDHERQPVPREGQHRGAGGAMHLTDSCRSGRASLPCFRPID